MTPTPTPSETPTASLTPSRTPTFTLTPSDAGTHLRMEQSGFRPDQRQAWGGANYGWRENLANLEAALARAAD